MGAKLTKSKSVAITKNTKELSTTVENDKPVEKKVKQKLKNKNSAKTKVDKGTVPSSMCPEQLHGDQKASVAADIDTVQVNTAYPSEASNKQLSKLHENNHQPTSNENEYQVNVGRLAEEVITVQS